MSDQSCGPLPVSREMTPDREADRIACRDCGNIGYHGVRCPQTAGYIPDGEDERTPDRP